MTYPDTTIEATVHEIVEDQHGRYVKCFTKRDGDYWTMWCSIPLPPEFYAPSPGDKMLISFKVKEPS